MCCYELNIFGLSFGDVNGDGRIDVLSQSNGVPLTDGGRSGVNLNVMLNLGTGFGAPQIVAPFNAQNPTTSNLRSLGFYSALFADMNGDGKLDLVLGYQQPEGNNAVATLLGAGDGTFATPVVFNIGVETTFGSPLLPIVIEDVNADAKPDVILGSGVVLTGDGDGTLTAGTPLFSSAVTFPNAPPVYAVSTAPATATIPQAEGTPFSALVFLNLGSSANAVFIPHVGSSVSVSPVLTVGTHALSAKYSGDADYAPSTSGTEGITISQTKPRTVVTSSASPSYIGENVTFTAKIGPLLAGATGNVVFSDGNTTLGTVPVGDGTVTFTTSFSSAGSQTITAAYSGDSNNGSSTGSMTQEVDTPVTLGNGGPVASLTVASGQSVTTQVSVTGAAGFGGTVSFSCTGLPANAACTFSPATVTVSGTLLQLRR